MTKFQARQGTIKFSTSAITFDTGTLLDAESWATTVTQVKNISLSRPELPVEIVNFIGETSGFQNAIYDEKPATPAKLSMTVMITGDEVFEAFSGGGTAITGSYTRRDYGNSTTNKTRVKVGAILINLDNGSEEYSAVLNNVFFTKAGDIKPTGTDGHFEIDVECECLPVDFMDEFKD